MSTWHAVRIRGDLYRMVVEEARAQRRSVASQVDVLLSRALDREPGSLHGEPSSGQTEASDRLPAPASDRVPAQEVPAGPQPSPPSDEASGALRGRGVEAGVNGGGGAAQITVDEALGRCPVCNDSLDDERRCVDPECSSHRTAS